MFVETFSKIMMPKKLEKNILNILKIILLNYNKINIEIYKKIIKNFMSWKNLIGFNHKEYINEPLKVILGEIPNNFRGTLYKNTAAMLKRKNGIPGHMFDGDGAILKV